MTDAYWDFAQEVHQRRPRIAIILGSGLGHLGDRLRDARLIPFGQLPDMDAPSVPGHHGALLLGEWAERSVLLFTGRVHGYEGHSWRRVVQSVHIAHDLGVKILLATNAAGGIRSDLGPGDLMAIRDHIDWTRPIIGTRDTVLVPTLRVGTHAGTRCVPFADGRRAAGPGLSVDGRELSVPSDDGRAAERPDVGSHAERGTQERGTQECYSPRLIRVIQAAAARLGSPVTTGVYAQVTGPSYETCAEIRALRTCGADAVGMSTTREIRAGFDLGMECAAISSITNKAAGLSDGPINHDEVLAAATSPSCRIALADIIEAVIIDSYLLVAE